MSFNKQRLIEDWGDRLKRAHHEIESVDLQARRFSSLDPFISAGVNRKKIQESFAAGVYAGEENVKSTFPAIKVQVEAMQQHNIDKVYKEQEMKTAKLMLEWDREVKTMQPDNRIKAIGPNNEVKYFKEYASAYRTITGKAAPKKTKSELKDVNKGVWKIEEQWAHNRASAVMEGNRISAIMKKAAARGVKWAPPGSTTMPSSVLSPPTSAPGSPRPAALTMTP